MAIGPNAIMAAIENNENGAQFLEAMLYHGVDPNLDLGAFPSPLYYCVEKSNLPAAEILLEYGADKTISKNGFGTLAEYAEWKMDSTFTPGEILPKMVEMFKI